jgi:hypothetical protein
MLDNPIDGMILIDTEEEKFIRLKRPEWNTFQKSVYNLLEMWSSEIKIMEFYI